MRQEVARRRLKNGKGPARHKKDGGEDQQRPAIANRRLKKTTIPVRQKKSLSGCNPARAKCGSSLRASSGQL